MFLGSLSQKPGRMIKSQLWVGLGKGVIADKNLLICNLENWNRNMQMIYNQVPLIDAGDVTSTLGILS